MAAICGEQGARRLQLAARALQQSRDWIDAAAEDGPLHDVESTVPVDIDEAHLLYPEIEVGGQRVGPARPQSGSHLQTLRQGPARLAKQEQAVWTGHQDIRVSIS